MVEVVQDCSACLQVDVVEVQQQVVVVLASVVLASVEVIGGAFTGGALDVVSSPGGTCSNPGGGRSGSALLVVPSGS